MYPAIFTRPQFQMRQLKSEMIKHNVTISVPLCYFISVIACLSSISDSVWISGITVCTILQGISEKSVFNRIPWILPVDWTYYYLEYFSNICLLITLALHLTFITIISRFYAFPLIFLSNKFRSIYNVYVVIEYRQMQFGYNTQWITDCSRALKCMISGIITCLVVITCLELQFSE